MNLSATLGSPQFAPRRQKLYDVGGGRQMSAKEIAARTGISVHAVYARVYRGETGKALLIKNGNTKRKGMARSPTQHIAFKIAFAFGRRVPTTAEIRRLHPMSDTSAMRWRNAVRQALESMPQQEMPATSLPCQPSAQNAPSSCTQATHANRKCRCDRSSPSSHR